MEPTTHAPSRSEHGTNAVAERNYWDTVRTLWSGRKLIIGVTLFAAIASVVISLVIPKWYFASARVLMPDDQGGSSGLLTAALGNLSGAARALIGGSGGDYTRYLAILTSRQVLDDAIERFDLITAYDLADSEDPLGFARKQLGDNTQFEVDLEYEFLSIGVNDASPERAAAMANFFVDKLNEVNATLSAQSASKYRQYVEQRRQQNRDDLDSARVAMQRFQERTGVIELPTMVEAYLMSVAELRANVAEATIQYDAARRQFGEDNEVTRQLRDLAASARAEERRTLGGQLELMPVAMSELPAVASEYARLYQEALIQAEMLQVIEPLYEQAKFEEEREKEAVQVVDEAVVPVRKAGPKRAVICIAGTLSAFILVVFFVLLRDWLRRNRHYLARQFNGI